MHVYRIAENVGRGENFGEFSYFGRENFHACAADLVNGRYQYA